MDTPQASPPTQLDGLEAESPPEARASSGARVAAAAAGWVAAALIPFDDLLAGLATALCCLAVAGLAFFLVKKMWPSLDAGPASALTLAAVATAFVRFAVPAIDPNSLFVKVGAYVLFLAAYAGFFAVGAKAFGVMKPIEERPVGYSFWRGLVPSLYTSAFITAALYLLARFFSPTLIALLVAGNVTASLTTHATRKAVYADSAADRRRDWVSLEAMVNHRTSVGLTYLLLLMGFAAYPIAAGVVYFTASVPSDELTIWVFRLTVITLFLLALPLAIRFLVVILSSANVDEAIRLRSLVSSFGGLFNVGLFLSLFFWSFGFATTEGEVETPNAVLTFSPLVVIALLLYFALAVLVPYAVGTTRARRQELRFLDVHRSTLDRLRRILERPHPGGVISALERASSDLDAIEEASMLANAVAAAAEEGEHTPAAVRDALPFPQAVTEDVQRSYDLMRGDEPLATAGDPRLRFWGQLRMMRTLIEEVIVTLKSFPGDADGLFRQQWVEFLGKRADDINRYVADLPRTRLPRWVTVGGLVAPLVSVVLDQFGNWIWTQIAESLPG